MKDKDAPKIVQDDIKRKSNHLLKHYKNNFDHLLMRKEIKIRAQASKGRIIISGNGNYKIVKSVVFSSQQMEILNKASKEIDPKPLLKR